MSLFQREEQNTHQEFHDQERKVDEVGSEQTHFYDCLDDLLLIGLALLVLCNLGQTQTDTCENNRHSKSYLLT